MQLMAIINCTPDSFSDGGRFHQSGQIEVTEVLNAAKRAVADGATILDIGGESTRPGSKALSIEEELSRVIPVIESLRQELPQVLLSVDTRKSEVAKKALKLGVNIINDVSGLQFDPRMASVVAAYPSAQFVLMHSQGNPDTMQKNPSYPNGVVNEVLAFFKDQLNNALSQGIQRHQLILDPGFGFGKTIQHNEELLKNLNAFQALELPILVGLSRKSFLAPSLNPVDRDFVSICAAYHAISLGVRIIRVHNVGAHSQIVHLAEVLAD
jgi:dihydropteroate synthase